MGVTLCWRVGLVVVVKREAEVEVNSVLAVECDWARFARLLTPAMGLNWADSGMCLGASGFGVNVWASFLCV